MSLQCLCITRSDAFAFENGRRRTRSLVRDGSTCNGIIRAGILGDTVLKSRDQVCCSWLTAHVFFLRGLRGRRPFHGFYHLRYFVVLARRGLQMLLVEGLHSLRQVGTLLRFRSRAIITALVLLVALRRRIPCSFLHGRFQWQTERYTGS